MTALRSLCEDCSVTVPALASVYVLLACYDITKFVYEGQPTLAGAAAAVGLGTAAAATPFAVPFAAPFAAYYRLAPSYLRLIG